MRMFHFIVANLKNIIALLAGVTVPIFMARNLAVSLREESPTTISMERWNTDHHGEQWLTIEGVVAADLAARNSRSTLFVPFVSATYQRGDPVQVVIVTNANWVQTHAGRASVTGVLAPAGSWRLNELMPGIKFTPGVVCLNEGTSPNGVAGPVAFIALGVVLVSLSAYRIQRSARGIWGAAPLG